MSFKIPSKVKTVWGQILQKTSTACTENDKIFNEESNKWRNVLCLWIRRLITSRYANYY